MKVLLPLQSILNSVAYFIKSTGVTLEKYEFEREMELDMVTEEGLRCPQLFHAEVDQDETIAS